MAEVFIWLRRARLRLGSGLLFFGSFACGELVVVKTVLKMYFVIYSVLLEEQKNRVPLRRYELDEVK